jgi:3-oxoadipate enol-lactonase
MNFIDHKGHSIHYKWVNNRKETTFVFINSLGTDFRIWDDVVSAMNDHANILCFDNRGHGLSDVVDTTKGMNDFANDTLFLVDSLAIRKCTIVGLSIGGMIAQVIANTRPSLIEQMILCDTCFKIGNEQFWNERIAAVNAGNLSGISEGVMLRWFSKEFVETQRHKVVGYRNMLERTPAKGYIHACEAIRDTDLTSMAKAINIPALCIVGEEDKSTTPDEVKRLADFIPGSKFETIRNSAHLPCVDNPDMLNKLIIDFTQK